MNAHFKLSKFAKRLLAVTPKAERSSYKRMLIGAESNLQPRMIMAQLAPKPAGYEGI